MTLASLVDPVCGMRVDPEQPKGGTHVHAGKTYGFCNPRCRERFAADPQRYLGARSAGSPAGSGNEGPSQAAAHPPVAPREVAHARAVQRASGQPPAAQPHHPPHRKSAGPITR
ncbi:MAG: YHS domain-containing protein, partial [Myxococcaceae bacterium]